MSVNNKRPMGHYSLTCILQMPCKFSSIATATGTQSWPYHKTIKGLSDHFNKLGKPWVPDDYTKIRLQSFLSTGEEDFKCFTNMGMAAILLNDA